VNVAHEPAALEPAARAATVGVYDGVHLGHRRILEAVRSTGLRSLVVTFDPHPRTVTSDEPIRLLCTPQRRLELLEEAGVDDVLVLPFDTDLLQLSPEAFAESILRASGVEIVVEGDGFRFGRGRSGDLDLLERLGFDVRRVPVVENISSTRIRRLLEAGEVDKAAQLLGRPTELSGTVVFGEHRGETLGFPTANLDVPPDVLVPRDGIYAGWGLGHRIALSIGTNLHYGGTERKVEGYLLDFEGDLYGEELAIEIWEHLRDEAAFDSEGDLIAAIAGDVERTRAAVRPV
jgi:riboflavin kinase / FMN adenylyltransferase